MKIRRITGMTKEQPEYEACYDLWKTCFGDSSEYMDYYFTEKVKDNVIYVLEVDGKIVSMLHLNPYHVKLGKMEEVAYYIVGVATDASYRKRGYMGQLIRRVFRDLYEEGHSFTYLMPAAYAIYAPYDFRYIYGQERMSGTINSLCYQPEQVSAAQLTVPQLKPKLELLEWGMLTTEQKEVAVHLVEEKLNKEFSVYATRSLTYYNRLALEMKAAEGKLVAIIRNGELEGLLAYMTEEKEEGKEVAIVETVGNELEVEDVLTILKAHVNEVQEVSFYETAFLRNEKQTETKPIIMARAIDVKHLLEGMCCDSQTKESIVIRVSDGFIEENNTTYRVEYKKDGCIVTEVDCEPEFVFDMPEFVEWFFEQHNVYLNEIV